MPIQRESDTEPDENESISEIPVVIPKYQVSQAKLDHLARARQRKAELAVERASQKQQEREEKLALSRGVKQVKDPVSKELIKKEILKATALRQPKSSLNSKNNILEKELKEEVPPPPQPIQKTRKEPKIVVEESEPEVIIVKRPKKKIVVEETETETEPEVKPKARRRRPKPVETESEYESDYAPTPVKKQPLKPPTAYQMPQFKINF